MPLPDTVELPDVELVAPVVHQLFLQSLKMDGVSSRLAYWGDELNVEWSQLSERAKKWNYDMVRIVYYCADVLSDRISL